MTYTPELIRLVNRFGGRLFTLVLEVQFDDYVAEDELLVIITPTKRERILVIGSFIVEKGFMETSFKCFTNKVQYCRHDPVMSECMYPVLVNCPITMYDPLYVSAWTTRLAQYPTYLRVKMYCAELPDNEKVRKTMEEILGVKQ